MTDEKKQIFTRRITKANRTQLIVIEYEILLTYLEDAFIEFNKGNTDEFKRNLGMVRECIAQLRKALDFNYDLSRTLFSIYCFADKELVSDIYGNKTTNLTELQEMFTKLKDAFDTISKDDDSMPLMDNIQDVYAGLTYGKNDLNESLVNYDSGRGFLV